MTSLPMVLQKRMKSISMAMFPDLYVMRWLSCFLKHEFPRSRSNARAYFRILSPSTSGSGLPYPIQLWRLERPCRPCRHWIQGSAWSNGIWQTGTSFSEILMLGSWQSQHAADQRTHHLDHSVRHTQTER